MCATNHRCPCLDGCEFGPADNADEHHEHGHYLCGKCSTESEYVICETCVKMGMDKEHSVSKIRNDVMTHYNVDNMSIDHDFHWTKYVPVYIGQ